MQSQGMETNKEGTSLPWVHAAYNKFKNRLQNFSRMVILESGITPILLKNQHAQEGVELVGRFYLLVFFLEEEIIYNNNNNLNLIHAVTN